MKNIPIYSGPAFRVHFPSATDDKGKLVPMSTVAWPDFIHHVYIQDGTYVQALGKDLKPQMVLDVNGMTVLIEDIEDIKYHGQCIQPLMIGYPNTNQKITRKEFKRKVFEDAHIEWVIVREWEDDNQIIDLSFPPGDDIA